MIDEDKKRILKESYKEAMKEFLEHEKGKVYKSVGQWVINGVAISLAIAALYFVLKINGWSNAGPVKELLKVSGE